ncbi:hypothetical protein BLNAU_13695 [Blattamonas nauphoetae]|uniref:Uncharacterized protein n=1 Tax=Blattamonas nauphoetae TaxID=2049346 RepID=A0ABQ9XH30_9EUKA|nr:hypothetical protein BLNAU_13695 [Blattamonas nauphoetae]
MSSNVVRIARRSFHHPLPQSPAFVTFRHHTAARSPPASRLIGSSKLNRSDEDVTPHTPSSTNVRNSRGHQRLALSTLNILVAIALTQRTGRQAHSDLSSPKLLLSGNCTPFLKWNEGPLDSGHEQAIIFRSLVATLQLQPVLDDSLEAKAVRLLEYVNPDDRESADAFLVKISSFSDDSKTTFMQSIVVLISSAYRGIITASMEMLKTLFFACSPQVQLDLVNADLIPQLIITLNPLSLSFAEAVDIHINLLEIIDNSVWLTTPYGLTHLEVEDDDEQQAVRETVLKQVLVPSEKYIHHLCENRFSIIDGDQSMAFLALLAKLVRISPYYLPTMDLILTIPVILTIPSCLTFFETESSIWTFLDYMINIQRQWNKQSRDLRRPWTAIFWCLRMEGFEDVIEKKLLNEQHAPSGRFCVGDSTEWSNLQGMNILKL